MIFRDIPGNKRVKKQLIQSVKNNRIAHAQIFSGNRGSAKLALAISYARYLNCHQRLDNDSCQKCSSCLKYNTLSHPDLHFVFPVIKKGTKTKPLSDYFINIWREFIKDNVYESLSGWINIFDSENKAGEKGLIYTEEVLSVYKKVALKNFEGKFKIFLFWMPEKMALQTSNRLLKLFEEPPARTIFLLVSETPNQLLPTISSRLQKIKVNNFSLDDAVLYFKQANIDIEEIKVMYKKADCDFGKIHQLIEGKTQMTDLFDFFSSWMRLVYKLDMVGISKWVNTIATRGKKNQTEFLLYTIKIIRDCLLFNFSDRNLLKTNQQETEFISKLTSFVHENNIAIIIEKLEKSVNLINRNANAKILFFELSLQMSKLLKVERKTKIR